MFYSEGLVMLINEMIFVKHLFLPTHVFCFAPLQVLSKLAVGGLRTSAVQTYLNNSRTFLVLYN